MQYMHIASMITTSTYVNQNEYIDPNKDIPNIDSLVNSINFILVSNRSKIAINVYIPKPK